MNEYNYTSSPGSLLGFPMKGNEMFEPVDAIVQIYTGSTLANRPPTIAAPGLTINGMTYDESIYVQARPAWRRTYEYVDMPAWRPAWRPARVPKPLESINLTVRPSLPAPPFSDP